MGHGVFSLQKKTRKQGFAMVFRVRRGVSATPNVKYPPRATAGRTFKYDPRISDDLGVVLILVASFDIVL